MIKLSRQTRPQLLGVRNHIPEISGDHAIDQLNHALAIVGALITPS